MADSLDIAEVARRTGLSSRALRFYEARGLLEPLRTASGRRYYGQHALERLHQIVILKRAGLSLAQIQRLQSEQILDLVGLINAQLKSLERQSSALERSRQLLVQTKSRIERSEPLDVATFCSLIEHGERIMVERQDWDEVSSRYFSEEQKERFAEQMGNLPEGFDHEAYSAKWKDLGRRIKSALPLDPASLQAQAFVNEWNELLAPFNAVATREMKAGVNQMYFDMKSWEGKADPGFDAEVFQFIQMASRAGAAKD